MPRAWDWSVAAVAQDGVLVLAYSKQGADQDYLALLDVKTSNLTRVPRPDAAPSTTGIADLAVSRRWLVWAETTTHDLFNLPWHLYSYDRRSGRTQRLASSTSKFGNPPPTPTDGLHLALHSKYVYFTAIAAVRRHWIETNIVRMRADGLGHRHTVVRRAYGAEAASGRFLYVRGHGGTFEDWEIHQRKFGNGSDRLVAQSHGRLRIGGSRAFRELVCWVADKVSPYPSEARFSLLCRKGSQVPRMVVHGRGYRSPHLVGILSGDRLVFTTENGRLAFVYDYSEDEFTQLVEATGVNRIVTGRRQVVYVPTRGPHAGRTVLATLAR